MIPLESFIPKDMHRFLIKSNPLRHDNTQITKIKSLYSKVIRNKMDILLNQGYFIDDKSSSVPVELTKKLLANIENQLINTSNNIWFRFIRLFNNVSSPHLRHSIPLKMTPELFKVLQYICSKNKSLSSFLKELVSLNGVLVELSAIVSLPGAKSQNTHFDLPYVSGSLLPISNLPKLCSIFVALQGITEEMGPTNVFPNTHSYEFHSSVIKKTVTYSCDGTLEEDDSRYASTISNINIQESLRSNTEDIIPIEPFKICCSEGLIYALDSRVAHFGGENMSSVPRYVLCFAFQRPNESDRVDYATGFTYHCHSSVVNRRYRLSDFF